LDIAQSNLEELGPWNELTVLLCEFAMAQGALMPPPVTQTRENARAPPPSSVPTAPPPDQHG
jgi:hypothetical protein